MTYLLPCSSGPSAPVYPRVGRSSESSAMRLIVLHVKVVHTAVFVVLSACVVYVLMSGAFNRITPWTWGAIAAIVVEGMVLAASGGKCPLTAVAERLGAVNGSVSDIFLPQWFADRIFPICGGFFLIGCLLIAARMLGQ